MEIENKKIKKIGELVDYLLENPNYEKITLFVRRRIERWDNLKEAQKNKLNIILIKNLNFLESIEESKKYFEDGTKYDSLFNCLGSRSRNDDFETVDYNYVVNSCKLCENLQIAHFSNCSSMGTDSNSWIKYLKVKGKAEDVCLASDVKFVSIMRPGILKERDNDFRLFESCLCCCCCCPGITTRQLAKAMIVDDLQFHINKEIITKRKGVRIENDELLRLAGMYDTFCDNQDLKEVPMI